MAGTYYKYAEREADSQVNWAEVGKGLSDMLAETNRVREEKKAAIDAATRETLNELAKSPNGEHKGARTAALEYADQASNYVRIQDNLLKRGQITLKEYTINRQNVNDGTDLAFNAMKVYQENYAKSMQRYRDGKASLYEIRKREQGEGFGNWTQSGLFIAPNGKVMAGMKTEKEVDGKKVWTMDNAPGKTASVDWVNGMLVGEWDKYDYTAPVKQFTEGLGAEIKSTAVLGRVQRMGNISSTNDITSRVDINPEDKSILFKFITAENDAIQAAMGTATDTFSILADHAKIAPNGKAYDVTNDPEEAKKNANLVLEVIDPNTGQGALQLSETQKKDAQEFLRGQMRAQYKYEEKDEAVGSVAPHDKPEYQAKKEADDKEAANAANMIGKLYYGNNNEVASGIEYFKGMKNKDGETLFKQVTRSKDGIDVVLANGETEHLSFLDTNNKPKSQEDFIRSAGPLLAGQLDVNTALQKGSYAKGRAFNATSTGSGTTVTVKDNYKKYIAQNLKQSVVGLSEEDAMAQVGKVAAAGGFTVEQTGAGTDKLIIGVPDGKGGYITSQEFYFDVSDATEQKDIYDAMVKYMITNASKESIKSTVKGGKGGAAKY